jgi:hypothetical protein
LGAHASVEPTGRVDNDERCLTIWIRRGCELALDAS